MGNGVADPAPGPSHPAVGSGRSAGVWATVVVILLVDQATKAWAVAALSDGPLSIVGDVVELRLARNAGGAFGRFSGFTPLLAIAAIGVSIFLARAARRETDRVVLAGFVLVLSGALGNLVDRVFRSPGVLEGRVVDFVKVGSWPMFNVADSCLTIGAVLLVVRSVFPPPGARSEPT